jgi:hypothetical protein
MGKGDSIAKVRRREEDEEFESGKQESRPEAVLFLLSRLSLLHFASSRLRCSI